MKLTDCFWEKNNLGKRVAEISIDPSDDFCPEKIEELTRDYDYVCVKVPVGKTEFNFGLTELGFTMIECQYRILKTYKQFDFSDRMVSRLLPDVRVEEVQTDSEFECILSGMTEDMFSTDRIVLDPHFSKRDGFVRYTNWMRTEYENKTSLFLSTYYQGQLIGFGMFRTDKFGYDALLGGVFERFQGVGLGLLTCCQAFIYAYQHQKPFKRMVTSISSNNVPVVELYNYFGYQVKETRYVYVRHNR